MDSHLSDFCYNIVNPLYDTSKPGNSPNLTTKVSDLYNFCIEVSNLNNSYYVLATSSEVANTYSKPVVWIGIYIAVASVLCIIAMGADLLHGFRNKKMWFPSKYFTLNAASITVIAVSMKLPVDLSGSMPNYLDQATKMGSLAFMCTMMANLMPSLASMDNTTLLANVVGLAILVITIVVNIFIEISTCVIDHSSFHLSTSKYNILVNFKILAYIYVVMLLWLLMIMISSAITIPSSKQILEFKYQAAIKRTLQDQDNLTSSMVEKLRQYVRRHWVMAESGSPQFVMASNQLSSTTGFKGVENFDSDQVEAITSVKLVNSWSLPVVALTCIAISLPNISKNTVDILLKNIHESLAYTHLVEEIVNNTCEYENIRKATKAIWHEVEEKCVWLENTIGWLENTIGKGAFRGKKSVEVLECFAKKAEEIVISINKTTNEEVMVNNPKHLILANSMYRVARTILFNYGTDIEMISEKELFVLLSSMIVDILYACFTNLPRVIETKCRESSIEKRESSVKVAAKLFGRTKEILKRLEVLELPSMHPDKMGFIDEWHLHLKQSVA
ncbi:uncharacterized protein [Rutidosis leptorrhynchoides]|uniref:uncharacterized protein n=1 Tax=Rutidosis leptorrhynchoides TaxID=125765 RepID=UPI003A9A47EB